MKICCYKMIDLERVLHFVRCLFYEGTNLPYKRLHCMIYKDYVKYEKALSSNNHKGKAYKNQVLQKNYSRSLFSAFFRNEEEKPYEERKKNDRFI